MRCKECGDCGISLIENVLHQVRNLLSPHVDLTMRLLSNLKRLASNKVAILFLKKSYQGMLRIT